MQACQEAVKPQPADLPTQQLMKNLILGVIAFSAALKGPQGESGVSQCIFLSLRYMYMHNASHASIPP
jgi:hypothetical protein